MSLEKVLRERIASLTAYRNSGPWRIACGDYPTLDSTNTPGVEWEESGNGFLVHPHKDNWFRHRFVVPGQVEGIPVEGSMILVQFGVLCPTELFVNGKEVFRERFWTDFQKPEVILTPNATPGESFEIAIHTRGPAMLYHIETRTEARIEIEVVEDVLYELETFGQELAYCESFPELAELTTLARKRAEAEITAKQEPMNILATIRSIRESLTPAAEFTKKRTVHLISHAHVDMNWLWDMDDTVEVCRRDFGTMCDILEEQPGFRFSQSQAAVYDIAQRHFPDIFARMQKAAAAGQWDVTAATWTEGDLNMSSGEAQVRHMLYSREFMREHFGVQSRVCWEPDTFGHPANTPQLLSSSGIHYYFHMRTTEGHPRFFHADTPLYWWEGIDGSRIMAMSAYYGGPVIPEGIAGMSKRMHRAYGLRDAINICGVGDHGGGPTRRDLKRARWLDSLPTLPRVAFSTTHAFFDAVADAKPDLPVWKGEMNPVFDGCYTSHADIKRSNREAENRLLEAEAASTIAFHACGSAYPHSKLQAAWRTLCFNQFHDIFDGCAIHSTYELAGTQMSGVLDSAEEMIADALRPVNALIGTSPAAHSLVVWNLLGFARTDLVEVDLPKGVRNFHVVDAYGTPVPSQVFEGKLWFVAVDVPAMGYRVYTLASTRPITGTKLAEVNGCYSLSSATLEALVESKSGCIVQLTDKQNGQLLIRQRDWYERKTIYSNLFQVEHEIPHPMSAWIIGGISRIDRFVRGAKVRCLASGPVADVLEITHRFRKSKIRQQMVFHKQLKRIDFRTMIDWREVATHTTDAPMLAVSFTAELQPDARVTWDIPFGNVVRPANGIEYAALKWIDVSDNEAGLSLLNDCKYGFSAKGTTLRMSCIRTSCSPDPLPDRGQHQFSYALCPHVGDWKAARIPETAAGFNAPLRAMLLEPGRQGSLPRDHGWLGVKTTGAMVTSLKRSIDGQATIVRSVETDGAHSHISIAHAFGELKVSETRPTEEPLPESETQAPGRIDSVLKPFEVRTWRLQ